MNFKIETFLNHLQLLEQEESQIDIPPKTNKEISLNQTPDNTWIPLLLLNKTVLFPGLFLHINIQAKNIINIIKRAYKKTGYIGILAPKRNKDKTKISIKDLHSVGTYAKIHRIITLPENQVLIILEGKYRFHIHEIAQEKKQTTARVLFLEDTPLDPRKQNVKALVQSIKEATAKTLSLIPNAPPEIQILINNIKDPVFLTYHIASNTSDFRHKQKLLEIPSSLQRATLLLKHLLKTLEFTQLKHKIRNKVHTSLDKVQHEFYLKQQIKVLQNELGENTDELDELNELHTKAKKKKWDKTVSKHFQKTLDRASKIHPQSAEYTNLINYAHTLVDLPWEIYSKDNYNLRNAEKILNKEHYGMEKVKERILEFLAVHSLTKELKGKIICLHGPPGIGKTSLCKSIAQALGRKYVKMSLGGLHDEAELRGHRKTYVGAMMGKVMSLIKNAGTANPLFVFDEIDKIDSKRGDPSSALLEILDPTQNNTFVDNFLEIPFDLSKVLFIATANDCYNIPWALADRIEFIEVNGYALEEKIQIAKKHLFPKQRKAHGLKASDISITEKGLIKLIESYTSESGVRELTRKISALNRKIAKKLILKENYPKKLHSKHIALLLGIEEYDKEQYERHNQPGIGIGLAWTAVGGEILFIESNLTKGEGKLTISGQLGEVMEESATAAHTYLKANADKLSIDQRIFKNYDLHIHVPDGATPKDGPSAGIALFTTLVSLYTQHKVKEKLAMTGEITLRGTILPVGGIKEKILAAKRAGIKEVILSTKNKKDVQEIKTQYIKDLTMHYIEHVDDLLPLALEKNKTKKARVWTFENPTKKQTKTT